MSSVPHHLPKPSLSVQKCVRIVQKLVFYSRLYFPGDLSTILNRLKPAKSPVVKPVVPNSVSFSKNDEKVTFNGSGPVENCALKIGGMTCASCVNNIEKTISKVPGVETILVSLMSGRANVTYTSEITPEEIAQEVEDMGFDAEGKDRKLYFDATDRLIVRIISV